jgi:hypothetical protein
MRFAWYDLIGTIGVAAIILTYILLQTEKLKSDSLAYSVVNAFGAGMVVFSLIYSFNFSAFIVESLWVLISLYGIGKYFFAKK